MTYVLEDRAYWGWPAFCARPLNRIDAPVQVTGENGILDHRVDL